MPRLKAREIVEAALAERLRGIFGDVTVLTSPEGLRCYCCDGTALQEAISKVARRIQETPWERELLVVIFGHIGNGYLHPNMLFSQDGFADHAAVVVKG